MSVFNEEVKMENQEGRIVSIDILFNEGWKKERHYGLSMLVLLRGNEKILYSLPDQKIIYHCGVPPYPILGC